MRPEKMIMSAFGSYAGEVTIDFNNVKNGLFLITGDTGAGKTTIFDAITYALYDRTSGGRRDGSMMRSQYASPDQETFVDLTFSYRDEQYRIRRNPEYQRAGKRKKADGSITLVKEASSVELTLPDGSVFRGKKKETDQKIVEIIGLDAAQFTQIAMIAQGDFLKLLLAESKERKRIFSQIFQTKVYWLIQEKLKVKAGQLYGKLEDSRKDVQRELEQITLCEDTVFRDAWAEFYEGGASLDRQLELLREILKEDDKILDEAEYNHQVCQKTLEKKRAVLQQKEMDNQIFISLDRAKARQQELENVSQQYQQMEEQIAVGKKILQIQAAEKPYLNLVNIVDQLTQNLERNKELLHSLLEEQAAVKEKAETTKTEFERERPILEKAVLESDSRLELFDKLSKQQKVWRQQAALVEKGKRAMEQCMEDVKVKGQRFEQLYTAFFQEQAGILAAELQDGMPCPVCGSTYHPEKAVLSGKAPSQQDLENAKQVRNEAESKRDRIQLQFQKVMQDYEAAKTIVLELQKQVFGDFDLQEDLDDAKIQSAQNAVLKQRQNAEHKKKELESAQIKAEKEFQSMAAKVQKLEGQLVSEAKNLQDRIAQSEQAYADYQNMLAAQSMTEEDYHQSVIDISQIPAWEKRVQDYQKALLENKGRLEILEQQVEGKAFADVEDDKAEIADLTDKETVLRKMHMKEYQRSETNRKAYQQLQKHQKAMGELVSQYEVYSQLNKTANGTLSGSAKLDFETYVQRQYFKKIIHSANKRLARMTNNEFILKCRDIQNLGSQGQSGLDLDVHHLVNDSIRDVKTLSGGEAFMASLSMALGLADIVQNEAGAVHMETMFVDEGFGSLDDSARAQAVQILKELADGKGLVGIISHVNELKEQIDCKLVIEKTRKGSVPHWEF